MVIDLLLFMIIVSYIFICPFTKVEESFNMQAMYDLLHFGLDTSSFDHLQFPGVVPRTFIGSILVSIFSYPSFLIMNTFHVHGIYHQIACRVVLSIFTWLSFIHFRSGIAVKFSKRASQLTLLLIGLQFHLCFYASRSLPNTFALMMVLNSFALWLKDAPLAGLILLATTTVIFRCDMFILLVVTSLYLLIFNEISFLRSLLLGLTATLTALTSTVLIDSYFWQKWLWPEGVVLFFNTVESRSSEWGIMTWHWYVSNALPKSLLLALPWYLLGLCLGLIEHTYSHRPINSSSSDYQTTIRSNNYLCAWYYLVPSLAFIALYSYLPHKASCPPTNYELRFILPVLPMFNLVATVTIDECLPSSIRAAATAADNTNNNQLYYPLSLLARRKPKEASSQCNLQLQIKQPILARYLPLYGPCINLAVVGSFLVMFLLTNIFLMASRHNYPGGEALEHFLHTFVRTEAAHHHGQLHGQHHSHRYRAYASSNRQEEAEYQRYLQTQEEEGAEVWEPTFIHLDVYTATTGVTRFLQDRFLAYPTSRLTRHSSYFLNTAPERWYEMQVNSSSHVQLFPQQQRQNQARQRQSDDEEAKNDDKSDRFGDLLVYSKDESVKEYSDYDYLITETPEVHVKYGQFIQREVIRTYDRLRFTWSEGVQVVLKNKLYILENTKHHEKEEDNN